MSHFQISLNTLSFDASKTPGLVNKGGNGNMDKQY